MGKSGARRGTEAKSAPRIGAKKRKAAVARSSGSPLAPDPAAPEVEGSEEAYRESLPEAQKLPASEVLPFRADAALAYHNAGIGVAAVLEHEAKILEAMPKFDFGPIRALDRLGTGLIFAATQAEIQTQTVPGRAASLLSRARPVREVMLEAAEVLAKKRLLPAGEVKRIREGTGSLDTAKDCIALAALYRKHEEMLRGKNPITSEDIEEASAVGTELVRLLKPKRGRRKNQPRPATDAVAARDRLWTLLVRGYDLVERTGGWLFGRRLGEHVPPLQSRTIVRTKKRTAGSKPGVIAETSKPEKP